MGILRVALAQINSTVGDLQGNSAKIIAAMDRAIEAAADIVTFPELAVCGYPPEDLLLKPGFLRDCRHAIDDIIQRSEGLTSLVGFPDAANGRVYNAAALISNGHLVNIYHKVELPNYGVFDEKRYFSPGSYECVPFEIGGVIMTVNICEDIWIMGSAAEYCVKKSNARIVMNISASPFHAGKLAVRREIITSFAQRMGVFVCYNNLVGGQDELVFDGGSLIISPQGELIATANRFQEDLLVTDIDTGSISHDKPTAGYPPSDFQRIVLSALSTNLLYRFAHSDVRKSRI